MNDKVSHNIDYAIYHNLTLLDSDKDNVHIVRALITLYNANDEPANAMRCICHPCMKPLNTDIAMCRVYTFAKMVPKSIELIMSTAEKCYGNVVHTTEFSFYMADLYFDAKRYEQACVEIAKCQHPSEFGWFERKIKLLTFEIMWKQEQVHKWIYLMKNPKDDLTVTYLRALHFMRICEYGRAICLFEDYIAEVHRNDQLKYAFHAYNLLLECYVAEEKEFPVIDGDTDARYRLCAHCHTHIDRAPLLEKGTDFLVCGQCKQVAFCSVECNDNHWSIHETECGKRRNVGRRIDFFDDNHCSYCFRTNTQKQCAKCQSERYCDVECQKKAWAQHKKLCK